MGPELIPWAKRPEHDVSQSDKSSTKMGLSGATDPTTICAFTARRGTFILPSISR